MRIYRGNRITAWRVVELINEGMVNERVFRYNDGILPTEAYAAGAINGRLFISIDTIEEDDKWLVMPNNKTALDVANELAYNNNVQLY